MLRARESWILTYSAGRNTTALDIEDYMLKRLFVFLGFVALPLFPAASALGQESAPPPINVTVDLVQLNVAVTDQKVTT